MSATGSRIRIEGAGDGDLAEILREYEHFWGDIVLPRYLHHPMFFVEFRDTAFVARDLDSGRIAGYLLGFVAPTGDGYIHFVAVRDDSRTLGLGSALYDTFEKAARERGAVALKAITNPENEGSVAFHARLGFTKMERIEDYAGGGKPRVVMRKPLTQGAGSTALHGDRAVPVRPRSRVRAGRRSGAHAARRAGVRRQLVDGRRDGPLLPAHADQ